MTAYGYARVSTADQDLTIQIEALRRAGCDVVREEKRSGTTREVRAERNTLLTFLRAGDELVVTRIDRLARSIGDLQDIVRALKAKGVALKATEQPIDTTTAAGKCFLDMLGVFAEFETNLRRERQMEGIAKAKAAGVYKGRPPRIDGDAIRVALKEAGPSEVARKLGVSRATIYRANGRSPRVTDAHSDYLNAYREAGSEGVRNLIKERFPTDRERKRELFRLERSGWNVTRSKDLDREVDELEHVEFVPPLS